MKKYKLKIKSFEFLIIFLAFLFFVLAFVNRIITPLAEWVAF